MELDRATMKKLMLLIAFAVLLLVGAQRYEIVLQILSFLLNIIAPFLAGAAVAFVLNVPMRFLERKLFGKLKKNGKMPRFVRPLSLLLTILLVILVILVVILVVVPQLSDTIRGLGVTISAFFTRTIAWAEETFANNPQVMDWLRELSLDWRSFNWQEMLNAAMDFLKNGAGDMLGSAISAVSTVANGIVSGFISFVFACYILLQKEKLGLQCRKILYALLPQKTAKGILEVCGLANRIFSSFITGQCLEALILGSLFVVTMTLLRMPYALLVGCLIAVTALIPIVGAFIGCGVGAFLILMESPTQALIFVIMFLVLQQVEGNLIYPHVVGNSVGLPSIWVLMAVTLGGSLMGVAGMLLFIPFTSVLYTLFRRYIYRRLREKRLRIE